MQQLTGLDAAFLALEEQSGVYGHVGSVCILDPSTCPTPFDLDHVTRLIESRLHLVPPFRRRLVEVPFGLDQPYWIEDPDFDLEFHVREIALPAPGDHDQLAAQAERLHARHLDRRRPLWELYLIQGLQGDRVAIYSKVHHAAIDGVSGNDLLAAVLDVTPEGRDVGHPPPFRGEEAPSTAMLLGRSARTLAGNPVRAARLVYTVARSIPALATSSVRPRLPIVDNLLGRDSNVMLEQTSLRAPATPFNRPVGPHRRWAYGDLPLAQIKAVKRAAELTVNDTVLAICAGALRTYLEKHGALPAEPLVVSVPVSVRTEDQEGAMGNRVSSMMAPLPTNLSDPIDRLRAVGESMRAAKEQHQALPATLLSDVTQFAMPALAGQAARLAARLRVMERVNPFNLIISNVPGPPVTLYYGGAELLGYYPLSAIADGQGLNMTVLSYRDTVFYGLIADRDLMPDVDVLGRYMEEELDTLHQAVAT